MVVRRSYAPPQRLAVVQRSALVRQPDQRHAGSDADAAEPVPDPRLAGKASAHYHRRLNVREEITMATLTVTARGQVTFRKEVLQHLGIKPGEKIELDLVPDGRGILKAARPSGTIGGFVGLRSDKPSLL